VPADLTRLARRLAVALVGLGGCNDAAEFQPRLPVSYTGDLALDIPMTGDPGPLFSELDTAMRQFLKWRCVGAGTLAISYKGRRVYKRGFGRMRGRASETAYPGCGDDKADPFFAAAALVQPDTPMYIGSNSKPIAAAVLRWLLDQRIAERPEMMPPPCEGALCSCGTPPCPASVTDMRLLDAANDLLPARLLELYRGDVPLLVPQSEEPCTRGHDPKFADPRWHAVTIGNLISHQAGLGRSAVHYFDDNGIVRNFAALRGHRDGDQAAWIAEDASLRAANPELAPAIDAAGDWLSAREGDQPVYFVNRYNVLGGEQPVDEGLKVTAGACLAYTPGVEGVYTEEGLYDPLGRSGGYSNFGYTMAGRIIDHLYEARTGGHYHAEYGRPETHWNSALAGFFAEQLGIHEGVETPEGVFAVQGDYTNLATLGHPVPRIYNRSWEPAGYETKRPFCVWRGERCDFEPWLLRKDGPAVLCPDLKFRLQADDKGFPLVPFWAGSNPQIGHAAGGLVSEAPVYLEFSRKYFISGRSSRFDNGSGKPRTGSLAGRSGGHVGSLSGGHSFVAQLVGDAGIHVLPPLVNDHMVDDFDHLQMHRLEIPGEVDFVVSINQNADPRCTRRFSESCDDEYGMLRKFVLFGLSRVDWAAMDQQLEAQRDQVVGMAIAGEASHFWFADDHHVAWNGAPDGFPGRGEGGDPEAVIPGPLELEYALPSTRIGPDVLAVAVAPDGQIHAWFNDGRFSVGEVLDLSSVSAPDRFAVAADHTAMDIVAVAIAGDGVVHAWYADGTWSAGTASDLAATATGSFELPSGRAPADIAAISFDPAASERVWTRFHDASSLAGTVTQPASL